MIDQMCTCKDCSVELIEGKNWSDSYKGNGKYRCIDCEKIRNDNRMFVNGQYVHKSHPLWKSGRYKSFNDAAFSSLQNYATAKEGYVYVITNPAWPNWVKIGMAVDAEDRLNGYQTSSPMRDYKLEYSVKSNDRRKAEKKAHKMALKKCDDAHGEWFKMSVREALELLDNLNG